MILKKDLIMKKTLLALAVAAVATSASAATVYSNEGTQVDVGGHFDVVLGKFGKDQRTDLRNNESRINFQAQHDLGNGLKALGYARLRFDEFKDGVFSDAAGENSFGNPVTNKLWLGLEQEGVGRVSFGKQNTTGDEVQLNDNAYFLGGNNNLFDHGDKVVSFRSADFEVGAGQTLGFGLDYAFGEARKNQTSTDLKNAYGASLFYTGDFSGLTLKVNAGYTVANDDNNSAVSNATGEQLKSWRVASQLAYAGAEFGVEYGQTRQSDANVSQNSYDNLLVAASYQVLPQSKVFTQWQRNTEKKSTEYGKTLENVYIVGADYEFAKNVVSYVQFAQTRRTDGTTAGSIKSKDNAYGVGLRVYF